MKADEWGEGQKHTERKCERQPLRGIVERQQVTRALLYLPSNHKPRPLNKIALELGGDL